jgi:hypothetical protein
MRTLARNIVGLLSVIALAITYLEFFGERIPPSYAVQVNFLLVPILLGVASSLILDGPLWLKLILLLGVPIAHVSYFGHDDAKPGIENMVAAVEYFALCVGVVIATLLRRWKARRSAAV